MGNDALEALKQEVRAQVQAGRKIEPKLYIAMAKFYDVAKDLDFLVEATGKSQRTVYHYLAVGWGLINGHLTAKQVEVHGYSKIIASSPSWLKGDSSWAKRSKSLTVAACLRGKGVKVVHFTMGDRHRERLSEALLMAGAVKKGKGLLNKEEALMILVESYITLIEDHAGLKGAS
jgi:hypothetical protein